MPFLWLNALQQEPKGPNSDAPMYKGFQELVVCACTTSPPELPS
jgi:hypothetical protein